jgi:hypothetical protein
MAAERPMSNAPEVGPGDWIKVGSIDGVVTDVRSPVGAELSVVCNPDRPAVYPVNWDGEAWTFSHPMRGGYAEHSPDVGPHVEALKRGLPED